jgi:hypothetical protein
MTIKIICSSPERGGLPKAASTHGGDVVDDRLDIEVTKRGFDGGCGKFAQRSCSRCRRHAHVHLCPADVDDGAAIRIRVRRWPANMEQGRPERAMASDFSRARDLETDVVFGI